jgi:hypothetical protein
MAQYLDTDGDSTTGRRFVIQAPTVTVINDAGEEVDVLAGVVAGETVANIPAVDSPFASLTVAADAHNALLAALKTAGVMEADAP